MDHDASPRSSTQNSALLSGYPKKEPLVAGARRRVCRVRNCCSTAPSARLQISPSPISAAAIRRAKLTERDPLTGESVPVLCG